jgi:hypothetical protein
MLSYYITSKFHFLQLQQAPVAQWIERLFPKQKVVGSTPTWRDFIFIFYLFLNFVIHIHANFVIYLLFHLFCIHIAIRDFFFE